MCTAASWGITLPLKNQNQAESWYTLVITPWCTWTSHSGIPWASHPGVPGLHTLVYPGRHTLAYPWRHKWCSDAGVTLLVL